mmetsp:Transcript_18314/g.53404  ORF Transcript_18314/g.53404 Transcript_18314/m.53404 type:complete len:436 (+) Transcript_18314:568-1875(+)
MRHARIHRPRGAAHEGLRQGGGHVVCGRHRLHPALRLPALLRRERRADVPENPRGAVQVPQPLLGLHLRRGQGFRQQAPRRGPTGAHDGQGGAAAQVARRLQRVHAQPLRRRGRGPRGAVRRRVHRGRGRPGEPARLHRRGAARGRAARGRCGQGGRRGGPVGGEAHHAADLPRVQPGPQGVRAGAAHARLQAPRGFEDRRKVPVRPREQARPALPHLVPPLLHRHVRAQVRRAPQRREAAHQGQALPLLAGPRPLNPRGDPGRQDVAVHRHHPPRRGADDHPQAVLRRGRAAGGFGRGLAGRREHRGQQQAVLASRRARGWRRWRAHADGVHGALAGERHSQRNDYSRQREHAAVRPIPVATPTARVWAAWARVGGGLRPRAAQQVHGRHTAIQQEPRRSARLHVARQPAMRHRGERQHCGRADVVVLLISQSD